MWFGRWCDSIRCETSDFATDAIRYDANVAATDALILRCDTILHWYLYPDDFVLLISTRIIVIRCDTIRYDTISSKITIFDTAILSDTTQTFCILNFDTTMSIRYDPKILANPVSLRYDTIRYESYHFDRYDFCYVFFFFLNWKQKIKKNYDFTTIPTTTTTAAAAAAGSSSSSRSSNNNNNNNNNTTYM